MYQVRDGARTLRFEGTHLARSTSRFPDSERWIEFDLYRTSAGSYVLARVGMSIIFHAPVCPQVERYGLHESEVDALRADAVPCDKCNPSFDDPFVFPEKERYWTLVSEEPDAILEALYKTDQNGARYLTNVAKKLLERAADVDSDIDAVYRIEYIA